MLCKYSVKFKDGYEVKCDIWIDVKEFKKYYRLFKGSIVNCVVWLDNGDCWIYYYGRFKWRWEIVFRGNK